MKHFVLLILLLATCQALQDEVQNDQKDFLDFQSTLKSLPVTEQIGFLEMGINSDKGSIFYFCLQSLLNRKSVTSLPLLEMALEPEMLPEDRRRLAYIHYMRLRYLTLTTPQEKSVWLLRLLASKGVHDYPELIDWAIDEYGDAGLAGDVSIFERFEKYEWLNVKLALLREKLALNERYPNPDELVIQAIQHADLPIRLWGLELSLRRDSETVAQFLWRWYEQHNLIGGRREFEVLKSTLLEHWKLWPKRHPRKPED